jgi:Protein of unknwon function (DUF3310)
MKDNVNPSHYKQGKVECIDAIEAATINKKGLDAVCTANVIKYIWRAESKGGVEDLKKAQWYLSRMIDQYVQEVPKEFVHPNAVYAQEYKDDQVSSSFSKL